MDEHKQLIPLSARYSKQVLDQTLFWARKCRDSGTMCGPIGMGTGCTLCITANGTPAPFKEIADHELADQPEGTRPLNTSNLPYYTDLRNFRFFGIPNPQGGIPKRGWYRRYNGTWERSKWNDVDSTTMESMVADLERLQSNDFRLCIRDPDNPDNLTDAPDRGPGVYITTQLDAGRSRNVTETHDLMAEINGTIPLDTEDMPENLSERKFTCAKCGHDGTMRRSAGSKRTPGLRCIECGTKRIPSDIDNLPDTFTEWKYTCTSCNHHGPMLRSAAKNYKLRCAECGTKRTIKKKKKAPRKGNKKTNPSPA